MGYGQDPRAVADWPWHEVLIWDAALGEVDRVQALDRGTDMQHGAALIGLAFHKPAELATEAQRLRAARRLPQLVSEDEAMARTQALLAQVALATRIARRRGIRGDAAGPFAEVDRVH